MLSSRGRLGNAVSGFILPNTAVKGVSRQADSSHKVTPCDTLGLPFPIELPEPRPVDFDRLAHDRLYLLPKLRKVRCALDSLCIYARELRVEVIEVCFGINERNGIIISYCGQKVNRQIIIAHNPM